MTEHLTPDQNTWERVLQACTLLSVEDELNLARRSWPPFNSAHEGYAENGSEKP